MAIDSKQAERAVVGIVLTAPETAIAAALSCGVKADWFADDTCRVAWMAVERMWAAGKADEADSVSLFAEWKRIAAAPETKKKNLAPRTDVGAVEELVDAAPPVAHLEHHCDRLRECFMLREARAACQRMASASEHADAATAIIALRAALEKAGGGE